MVVKSEMQSLAANHETNTFKKDAFATAMIKKVSDHVSAAAFVKGADLAALTAAVEALYEPTDVFIAVNGMKAHLEAWHSALEAMQVKRNAKLGLFKALLDRPDAVPAALT